MRIGYSDLFYSGWFTLSHSVDKIKSSGDTPSGPMQYHIYPPLHIILDLDFMLKLHCVILLKTRCLKYSYFLVPDGWHWSNDDNCEEQLPSTDFQPYVGQQLADSWPTLKGHV